MAKLPAQFEPLSPNLDTHSRPHRCKRTTAPLLELQMTPSNKNGQKLLTCVFIGFVTVSDKNNFTSTGNQAVKIALTILQNTILHLITKQSVLLIYIRQRIAIATILKPYRILMILIPVSLLPLQPPCHSVL
jgi:hypothetical protein